jgi:hypothetical protein
MTSQQQHHTFQQSSSKIQSLTMSRSCTMFLQEQLQRQQRHQAVTLRSQQAAATLWAAFCHANPTG